MEKKEIARRIAKFNIKHPFPEPKENWGPRSSVQMYRWPIKGKYGKIKWMTSRHWFGHASYGYLSYDEWSSFAVPPKCLWGMIIELDEFVGIIRMYEIRLDVPDLRPLKNDAEKAFWGTKTIWKKQDFEVYVDIQTNEIYDKNGNHIRKSDRVFPSVILDRYEGNEYANIVSIHRKLVAFNDMQQFYVNDLADIKTELCNMGYDVMSMGYDQRLQMHYLVEYLSKKPTMMYYGDIRTYIEKRNAFCTSWGEYRNYDGRNHIVKLPEKYNGKNVYKISFNRQWYCSPIIYIVGKDYCIYYINGVYVNGQMVCVTFINGKKTTSFLIDRAEKTVKYVQNQNVPMDDTINAHSAIQIFKDHPKLSWVTELPCFSCIRPDQIPALEKAYPVEQFIKMGLPYAAEGCLYRGSFTTNRENYAFDIDILKENTSALKAYGISRKQAEYIDEKLRRTALRAHNNYRYSYMNLGLTETIVIMLRRLFGVEELSKRLSNDFDIFVDWLYGDADLPDMPYWNANRILEHPDTQKYKNLVRIIKMYVQELRKPHATGRLNYFKDTINMWMQENHWDAEGFYGPDGIASTLRTPHDFQVLHDHLVEVRNARYHRARGYYGIQRTLAEQAEFERKAKKALELLRENYEYIGDSFRIVVPMTEAEITNEGQMLHHCVGGYATRHLERETTILFLRANKTPDRSYYTIEVGSINDSPYVVQIHGFGNKWIGNDPDAMRFAYHYFIDHNIRCDKNILLCTGMSYGGGNEALPESELY